MPTELIAMISVLGIGVVLGLIWYGHNKEKERAQKALLVASLSERAHRLQRLLDMLPDAYVEKDVRLLLLTQVKMRMEKLTELAPSNEKFKRNLDSLTAQISETQSSSAKPPIPQLKSPEEAKETKNLLQDLSKILESLAASKALPVSSAKKYLANIHQLYIEANINYSIQIADQSRRDNKTKLATHQYQKAITELSKHNQNNKHTEKISQLKEILKSLTGADEEEEEAKGDELSKGIKNLSDEDDSWKKKYF
ncbi:hypothetical protein A9Q99_02115 [Gammaproteobacteria bacterium 45_16_T64]|nr:hypothetical protein A9Q99_02115 [Gammaproteobacteria bacterium 45_16_T64]